MKNYYLYYASLFTILVISFGLISPSMVFGAGPPAVNLLTAGNFSLLSETGITNTGSHASVITGNIGSSPITAAAINDVFCTEITGTIYGVDAAYIGSGNQSCFAGNPPLSNKTSIDNAILDMGTAYTDAAGRSALASDTNLFAGNLGGQTITPGLYKWTTNVTIPTDVTLSGGASDIWIFQIAGNLNISSGGSVPTGIKVLLTGGAQASNVFWQVGGGTGATLGTYSTFNGNILSATQVVMQTGAVFNGRAMAQTLITLDANNVAGLGTVTLPIVPAVIPPASGGFIPPATPAINVSKTATPSSLPSGPGVVTYNYTIINAGGQRALTDIKISDNKCTAINYLSGDINVNNKIEPTETWRYSCTANLLSTTANTVTVSGISDDPYRQTASASTTLIVVVNNTLIVPTSATITTTPVASLAPTPGNTPVATPGKIPTQSSPTPNPLISPTKEKLVMATKTPITSTSTPEIASSTNIVPGLPNTGLPSQNNTPLKVMLAIGFISIMGLLFQYRKISTPKV